MITDGAVGSPEEEEALSELSDAYIDFDDQKKRVNNVARCLKIIADKIVEEKKRSGKSAVLYPHRANYWS